MALATCDYCLGTFEALRPRRARFCSDAHRAAARRADVAARVRALMLANTRTVIRGMEAGDLESVRPDLVRIASQLEALLGVSPSA